MRTTWDLGYFTSGLAPGHTSPPATKYKLYGTKSSCVHGQLGQILDKRYKETKKWETTPSSCHRGPSTALPGFLVWPQVNSYSVRKPRTLASNSNNEITDFSESVFTFAKVKSRNVHIESFSSSSFQKLQECLWRECREKRTLALLERIHIDRITTENSMKVP